MLLGRISAKIRRLSLSVKLVATFRLKTRAECVVGFLMLSQAYRGYFISLAASIGSCLLSSFNERRSDYVGERWIFMNIQERDLQKGKYEHTCESKPFCWKKEWYWSKPNVHNFTLSLNGNKKQRICSWKVIFVALSNFLKSIIGSKLYMSEYWRKARKVRQANILYLYCIQIDTGQK